MRRRGLIGTESVSRPGPVFPRPHLMNSGDTSFGRNSAISGQTVDWADFQTRVKAAWDNE